MRFLIPFIVAAVDQWVKHAVRSLPYGRAFFCVPGLFELLPSINTGAAFSLLRGNNVLLILLSVALMLFAIVCIYRNMHLTKLASTACMFLLGGGLGNLIDRIVFGGVTDYIRILFLDFPVFNLADICITCSVFVLIILLLINRLEEHESYE